MEYQFESIGPMLRWVSLAFLLVAVLAAIAVAAGLAALPGLLARRRNHPQASAINVCGWLGLPTGVLWVVAMVWTYLDGGDESSGEVRSAELQQLRQQIRELDSLVTKLEEAKG